MQQTQQKDASGQLFDHLIRVESLKNDAELARRLKVAPPVLSKIRHGRLPVGPTLIINIHETFGLPVATIRDLMAVTA